MTTGTTAIATTTAVPAAGRRELDEAKPRLRGWLHAYAFAVSIVCVIALCAAAATRPGWAPLVSCGIYATTVCALFGVSALYHLRVWSRRMFPIMRRLDHSMIFLFIAGTYTPFSVLLLPPGAGSGTLATVWGGAAAGVALKTAWPHTPRWLSVPLYAALGWVAVAVLPDIVSAGPLVLGLLLGGGVFYTAGAACYVARWPNPWPSVFGHHECFHACTLVAAACHYIAVYAVLYR